MRPDSLGREGIDETRDRRSRCFVGAGLEGFGMKFHERQEPEVVVVALTTTNALEILPQRPSPLWGLEPGPSPPRVAAITARPTVIGYSTVTFSTHNARERRW